MHTGQARWSALLAFKRLQVLTHVALAIAVAQPARCWLLKKVEWILV